MNKFLLAIVIVFTHHFVQAQNLLNNPGFEEGGGWWYFQGTANGSVDYASTESYSGSAACKIIVTTPTTNAYEVQLDVPSNWIARPSTKYRLTFYAKANLGVPFKVAVQGGPPDYLYFTDADYTLTNSWQKFELLYTSQADLPNVAGALHFNIFIGANAAQYYFDDFAVEEVNNNNLSAPNPPTTGAYYTDVYRNMFVESGKDSATVNTKVMTAFNQLFYGTSDQRLYFPLGNDMGYVQDIADNDIRTEGMSYGMMIAVQLNKKEEFDRLWTFAKTYMQHKSGPRMGYFAWQVSATDYHIIDDNSAPDGEEYIVTALFFAAHRWPGGTGIYDYEAEANQILHDMIHLEERNGGQVDGLTNMFNANEKKVVFTPQYSNADFTDPSYHLPGFYKLWALWAKEDNQFWNSVADTSKSYLLRAMHPVTGLTTDYMTFAATPNVVSWSENSGIFSYDSWRVIGNIGMDCSWFGNDSWQSAQVNKLLQFFSGKGPNYYSRYNQDGTELSSGNFSSAGNIAMNGAGAIASSDLMAWDFVDGLYNLPVPTGTYRYYDGMLYMLSMLHASGNFRIYKPAIVTSTPLKKTDEILFVYPNPASASSNITVDAGNTMQGKVMMMDLTGKLIMEENLVNGKAQINTKELVKGIYFLQISSLNNGRIFKKVIIQ